MWHQETLVVVTFAHVVVKEGIAIATIRLYVCPSVCQSVREHITTIIGQFYSFLYMRWVLLTVRSSSKLIGIGNRIKILWRNFADCLSASIGHLLLI